MDITADQIHAAAELLPQIALTSEQLEQRAPKLNRTAYAIRDFLLTASWDGALHEDGRTVTKWTPDSQSLGTGLLIGIIAAGEALQAKLEDMQLHDNTGDPRDEGYMAALQELLEWLT